MTKGIRLKFEEKLTFVENLSLVVGDYLLVKAVQEDLCRLIPFAAIHRITE